MLISRHLLEETLFYVTQVVRLHTGRANAHALCLAHLQLECLQTVRMWSIHTCTFPNQRFWKPESSMNDV